MTTNSDQESNPNKQAQQSGLAEYLDAIRSFNPSLRRMLISMALILFTAFGLQPVLQNLYLLRLGFDVQFIGLLAGIGQVAWAATALPAGMLGNRIGLRNGLLWGCALFGLGLALLLLVVNVSPSLWRLWLMSSQVVFWSGVALLTVNSAPYMMAVTSERERRHAFSVFSASGPTVAFIGSLLGGWIPELLANRLGSNLDQPDPYRWALWLGVLLAGVAIVILVPTDPAFVSRQESQEQSTSPKPWMLLVFVGLLAFLCSYSEGALRTFFNVYLDKGLSMAPSTIGLVMGFAQLLPIVAALAVPLLMNRLGTGNALTAGLIGVAIFLAVLSATSMAWVVIGMYMMAVAMLTIQNTVRSIFGQELFTARWRTSSQSISVIGTALAWASAAISGGVLIQASGFGTLYFIGALSALLGAGLLFAYLRAGRIQFADATQVAVVAVEEPPVRS